MTEPSRPDGAPGPPRTSVAERSAAPWEGELASRRLRVSETFVSLQGEGVRTGLPTAFLRLTGCALRCRWCDTAWAFSGGDWRTLASLEDELAGAGVPRVCVTGGEPLLQPNVVPLIERLVGEHGLDVVVETGGDCNIALLPLEAAVILDIKLPGSGMSERMDLDNIDRLAPHDEVKLVVLDRADYERAREIVRERLSRFGGEILLGAVDGELDAGRLADWILEDRLDVRLQTQLHKRLWPGRDRGV